MEDWLTAASRALVLTGSLLSLLGSAFIIASWVLFSSLRASASFRVVVWLSVADLGSAVAVLVDAVGAGSTAACTLAASLTQYFNVASLFWSSALAHVIYEAFVHGRILTNRQEVWQHALIWPGAFVLWLPPVAMDAFGSATIWCWIRGDPELIPLRLACYYIPLVIICAHNTAAYVLVSKRVNSLGPDEGADGGAIQARLRLYILVFIAVRTPSVLHRGYQLSGRADSGVGAALQLVHAICSPTQGFWNALIFGANRAVLAECSALLGRGRGGMRRMADTAVAKGADGLEGAPPHDDRRDHVDGHVEAAV